MIALAIGIVSISHLRLPDLRVGAILLCVFFLYDIFWVFLSPYFFSGQSVMYAHAIHHLLMALMSCFATGSPWQ